ncbi:MAG: glycosyltransferase [Actinomycetota bacterium]
MIPPLSPDVRRLVIVVRADPVICGHSGEARNLAEAALRRGFDDVRILTWPIDALGELPLKPLDSVRPYSPGITVERPAPVGDYKIPDGRYCAGLVGRLIELFTDRIPTACLSLYLAPHANVVAEALTVARSMHGDVPVTTYAEAVGSDITNVVRSCVEEDRLGAAAHAFVTYLSNDVCVAVSAYTRDLIVDAAKEVDRRLGTDFAAQCRDRVDISYPAIDATTFTDLDPSEIDDALARRGLTRDGYALFLSRITPAKGVDDLIDGYAASAARHDTRLVIAGTGNALPAMRERAATLGLGDRILFFDDVGDDEKTALMAGSAAYVLPSKPRPEFTETFGIALAEKMLAGGGPVITTETGGIPEAVGDTATVVRPSRPDDIAAALDEVLLEIGPEERDAREDKARTFAMQFDRQQVFDRLFGRGPYAA